MLFIAEARNLRVYEAGNLDTKESAVDNGLLLPYFPTSFLALYGQRAGTNKQQQSKSSVRGLADSKQPWPRLTTRLMKGNMADIAAIVEQLSGLTVMEVADLVKQLENKWGVTAAAPVAAAAAPAAGAAAAAPAEAQTT